MHAAAFVTLLERLSEQLALRADVPVGLGITGWQSSPDFWDKTTFLVVVFGIPIIAAILGIGWLFVRPKVIENTGGKMKAVWSDDGPTYGPDYSDDDRYSDDKGLFRLERSTTGARRNRPRLQQGALADPTERAAASGPVSKFAAFPAATDGRRCPPTYARSAAGQRRPPARPVTRRNQCHTSERNHQVPSVASSVPSSKRDLSE